MRTAGRVICEGRTDSTSRAVHQKHRYSSWAHTAELVNTPEGCQIAARGVDIAMGGSQSRLGSRISRRAFPRISLQTMCSSGTFLQLQASVCIFHNASDLLRHYLYRLYNFYCTYSDHWRSSLQLYSSAESNIIRKKNTVNEINNSNVQKLYPPLQIKWI